MDSFPETQIDSQIYACYRTPCFDGAYTLILVLFTVVLHMSGVDLGGGAFLHIAQTSSRNGNKNTTEKRRRNSERRSKRGKRYLPWKWCQKSSKDQLKM